MHLDDLFLATPPVAPSDGHPVKNGMMVMGRFGHGPAVTPPTAILSSATSTSISVIVRLLPRFASSRGTAAFLSSRGGGSQDA
jgi:hypothetical protein